MNSATPFFFKFMKDSPRESVVLIVLSCQVKGDCAPFCSGPIWANGDAMEHSPILDTYPKFVNRLWKPDPGSPFLFGRCCLNLKYTSILVHSRDRAVKMQRWNVFEWLSRLERFLFLVVIGTYVLEFIHTYVRVCACMYMNAHVCICMYVCVLARNLYISVRTCIFLCVPVWTCVCLCEPVWTWVCLRAFIYMS